MNWGQFDYEIQMNDSNEFYHLNFGFGNLNSKFNSKLNYKLLQTENFRTKYFGSKLGFKLFGQKTLYKTLFCLKN